MKLEALLVEETTSAAVSGGAHNAPVVQKVPMKRLKGQFASYGLGEKACSGCELIKTKYETLGSKKSPKLITCQMCGQSHKV